MININQSTQIKQCIKKSKSTSWFIAQSIYISICLSIYQLISSFIYLFTYQPPFAPFQRTYQSVQIKQCIIWSKEKSKATSWFIAYQYVYQSIYLLTYQPPWYLLLGPISPMMIWWYNDSEYMFLCTSLRE